MSGVCVCIKGKRNIKHNHHWHDKMWKWQTCNIYSKYDMGQSKPFIILVYCDKIHFLNILWNITLTQSQRAQTHTTLHNFNYYFSPETLPIYRARTKTTSMTTWYALHHSHHQIFKLQTLCLQTSSGLTIHRCVFHFIIIECMNNAPDRSNIYLCLCHFVGGVALWNSLLTVFLPSKSIIS